MKLHEYQAKALFRDFGIAVPAGEAVRKVSDVERVYAQLNSQVVVVKAQIHAGGRGKAGGVKLVKSLSEAKAVVEKLLGSRLVTHQTDKMGQPVNVVYIECASEIKKEYYFSLLLDRSKKKLCLIFSTEGGMEIEEVAHKNPNALMKFFIPLSDGFPSDIAKNISIRAGWNPVIRQQAADLFSKLYQLYIKCDCNLLEINPLILTHQDQLLPLDGKVIIDDNAAFRQPKLVELYDTTQDDPTEVEAKSLGLNYVALNGNIGCMVNGAGLAMATMDMIKLHGGQPANFLDVGGGANTSQIKEAFRLVLHDPRVKSVLVNIFGGILRCDVIAEGIIAAAKDLKIKVPVVVRLEGANVDKGKDMLAQSGLSLVSAASLDDGASVAVKLAQQGMRA